MSKQELKELGIIIPESGCDMYDDELDSWLEYIASGRYTEDKMYDTRKHFDNKAVARLQGVTLGYRYNKQISIKKGKRL